MKNKLILVGDNPFHGVSHVSRDRSLQRDGKILDAKHAAELVALSIKYGANGFTFTVSPTTFSILQDIGNIKFANNVALYPLFPNVNEFVRTAGAAGGLPGLAKDIAKKIATTMDTQMLGNGIKGVIYNNPEALFKAYVKYEYLRLHRIIKQGKNLTLTSMLLHEVVTDMALALDMQWLFRAHIDLMRYIKLKPGFETRNLPYFVRQFEKWRIGFDNIVIEAPFNPIGFQMCPSQADCEQAAQTAQGSEIIAFSILAAGYVKIPQAIEYVNRLSGISGIGVGVSSEKQASETFPMIKGNF